MRVIAYEAGEHFEILNKYFLSSGSSCLGLAPHQLNQRYLWEEQTKEAPEELNGCV